MRQTGRTATGGGASDRAGERPNNDFCPVFSVEDKQRLRQQRRGRSRSVTASERAQHLNYKLQCGWRRDAEDKKALATAGKTHPTPLDSFFGKASTDSKWNQHHTTVIQVTIRIMCTNGVRLPSSSPMRRPPGRRDPEA